MNKMAVIGSSIARDFFPITPHATNPVGGAGTTNRAYGIFVTGAGTVVGLTEGGVERTVTLAAGQTWPVTYTHIRATSTATGIYGFTLYI
jgi:hypothetical protein